MKGALYLAWKYLAYHRYKTAILVLSITTIAFVPAGLRVLVARSAEQLTARAESTPLVMGARGSPLELVLNSLYFESHLPPPLSSADRQEVADSGLAQAIPLYARFQTRGHPVVGTSPEYFELRDLVVDEGRFLAMLGECVVGSSVAAQEQLAPGDSLVTTPESVFDLAGVYPLRMKVVGILAPTHTPDDQAVFVDLKTAWVIEGLGHGHLDLSDANKDAVLSRSDGTITANASLDQYQEITPDNLDSFHFHGDAGSYPLTAILVIPFSDKQSALIQGRYQDHPTLQLVRPERVMSDLLDTVFTVQGFVIAAVVFVGTATLLTTALVFALSARLRQRERRTMVRIGAARRQILAVLGLEIAFVIGSAMLLAAGMTGVATRFGMEWIRGLILS